MDRKRFAFLGRADSPQADASDPAAMIEHAAHDCTGYQRLTVTDRRRFRCAEDN
jgi:hypothetical protein